MEAFKDIEMKSNKELQAILTQTEAKYQETQTAAQQKGIELRELMAEMERLSELYNKVDNIYQQRMGVCPKTEKKQ